jgi:DNA polymerase-1
VDNVPGVDKVGPKTAAKWIADFGSLDGVVAAAASIKGVAGENLRKALDWLPTGRKLITVVTDCDLTGHVPAGRRWKALALREVDRRRPAGLLPALRLQDLAQGTGGGAAWRAGGALPPEAARPTAGRAAGARVRDRHHLGALRRLAAADAGRRPGGAGHRDRFAGPMRARIVGISFATEPGRAAYVPLAHDYPGAPEQLPLRRGAGAAAALAGRRGRAKLGQNIKYDLHVLANHGITVRGYRTTPCCRAMCWKRTSRTAWKAWPSATWAARA